MAQKQTKKTTAAKGRKKAAPKKAQQKPIRREVGAGVCLLLAVFTVLACFQIHAAFLDALATLCRGLIGAGFYILPFAFLMGFLILLLHDGRPVALRVTCTFLVAVLIGSLVQLVGGGGVEWSQNVLENLWDGGIAGTSGGVVAGGLALVLELVVSKVGAVILCIAGFLLALITSLNMTVKGIILAIKNRPKLEYEPPRREHADPAEKLVNHVAERHIEQVERRRAKASDFDLPIDEPPLPVAEPKKKGREIVRPDEFVEQDRKNARREKPVDLTDDLPGELTGHTKPAAPKPEPKQEPEPAAKKDYKAQFDALISEQKELPHQLPPLVLDAEPEKLPTLPEEPKQPRQKRQRRSRWRNYRRWCSPRTTRSSARTSGRRPRRLPPRSRRPRRRRNTAIRRSICCAVRPARRRTAHRRCGRTPSAWPIRCKASTLRRTSSM